MSRYSVEWQPDDHHLLRVGNPRLYDHTYQSPLLPLEHSTGENEDVPEKGRVYRFLENIPRADLRRRTWDLRSYTDDTLALLTGRALAYGYFHTERFLADVARSNGAEVLTSAQARWTTRLWQPEIPMLDTPALFYMDGHRKPVYTDTFQ